MFCDLLMFGGSIANWKRKYKVAKEAQSPIAEAFEREMRRARVLIAEQELRRFGSESEEVGLDFDVRSSESHRRTNNAQDTASHRQAGLGNGNVDP